MIGYFEVNAPLIIALVITVILVVGWPVVLRLIFRDRIFTSVTPGDLPPEPQTAPWTHGRHRTVPIQFTPPAEIEPAEAALLSTGRVPSQAIAAAVVELIAKKYVEPVDTTQFKVTSKVGLIGTKDDGLGPFSSQVGISLNEIGHMSFSLANMPKSAPAAARVRAAKKLLISAGYETRGWFPRQYQGLTQASKLLGQAVLIWGLMILVSLIVYSVVPLQQIALVSMLLLVGSIVLAAVASIPLGFFLEHAERQQKRTSVGYWMSLGTGVALLVVWVIAMSAMAEEPAILWWQASLLKILMGVIVFPLAFVFTYQTLTKKWAGFLYGCLALLPLGFDMVVYLKIGWWVLALIIGGAVALLLARRRPPRTPLGSAAEAQVRGFKQYLETADIDQLRHEASTEVFSSYLPWAIVFQLGEKWTSQIWSFGKIGTRVGDGKWYDAEDGDDDEPGPTSHEAIRKRTQALIDGARRADRRLF